jgi:SulP family sulfate permease
MKPLITKATSVYQNLAHLFTKNIFSGITVALISLPLSIALSIASGGTPAMGIITGVWATAAAALFGSSNYNIVGVAGALTTVLFTATASIIGVPPIITLSVLAICTGIVILFVYGLRLDRYLSYIPASVMYGFATGVAILIAAGQLFDALGLRVTKGAEFIHNMTLLFQNISQTHLLTASLFIIFLTLLLVWKRYIKSIPGVIPMSLLGIAVGYILPSLNPEFQIVRIIDKFGTLEPILVRNLDIQSSLALLSESTNLRIIISTSLLVALIAVLETLITARIGDRMTRTEHNSRQELFGLGVSNIISGLLGGLPSTGVFIRTGANIKAGATHRMSQFLAAVITALLALVVMPYFSFIPLAVIAAILFNTAIGLIEVHAFKQYWNEERTSFWLAMSVTVITIIKDAGVAVIIGAIAGVFMLVHKLAKDMVTVTFNKDGQAISTRRGKQVVSTNDCPSCDTLVYSIAGFLNYLDVHHHISNIKELIEKTNSSHIIIRMRDIYQIDIESIEELGPFLWNLTEHGVVVDISSAHDEVLEQLRKNSYFAQLLDSGHFYTKTTQALHHDIESNS